MVYVLLRAFAGQSSPDRPCPKAGEKMPAQKPSQMSSQIPNNMTDRIGAKRKPDRIGQHPKDCFSGRFFLRGRTFAACQTKA
jgi:hypothetical protein